MARRHQATADRSRERRPARRIPTDARFRLDNLTSQSWRATDRGCFRSTVEGETYQAARKSDWKTNDEGMERLRCWAGRLIGSGNTLRYVRYHRRFPAYPLNNFWDDTGTRASRPEDLRRPDEHQGHRALHAHDHRPRRPGPRPDVRHRHDRLRRRAVGPALDHHRHQPRRAGAGPHAADGRPVPVLPARRLAGGRSARRPS